jgi:diaminopropionate ammonia-lyase
MLHEFPAPGSNIVDHVHVDIAPTEYPNELHDVLSPEMMAEARTEIRQWQGYAPTPVHTLQALARELDLAEILYKDEARRFGLGSFKALGGAYAVLKVLQGELQSATGTSVSLADIRAGKHAEAVSQITVASATAGNHGRSLAWGAQQAGCQCKIFIHAGVGDARKQVMESFGAEVIRVDGNYDDSVRIAAEQAEKNGWLIVSDTSYPGYTERPRFIKAGYTVIGDEFLEQLNGRPLPTHILLQTGCGGLAAGVAAGLWDALGPKLPRIIVVEPDRAPCLLLSARNGQPTNYRITDESMMVGLSCGDVSLLAWDIVSRCASDYLAITDDGIPPAMRLLASRKAWAGRIVGGESGVAGLAALIDAARDQNMRGKLGLDAQSRIMLIGSEGATSPDIYAKIVGEAA